MMEIGSNLQRQRIDDDEEHQIDIDRLTNLPDAVAHHILSFLTDIQDIARFNFTSKKCEYLCASIPSIVIDAAHICKDADYLKISRFMDFLVTLIRCRTASLTSLTIRWFVVTITPTQLSRIVSMLNSAATYCHATELNLTLRLQSSTQVFVLPLDLFYNESLKCFKMNLMMTGKLELPCPYGFCHLRILRLDQVEIGDRDIGNWISSFCKFLKELYLEKISGMSKFTYSGSSLQRIQIIKCALHHLHISGKSLKNITIVDPFDSSIRASLDILAPNVQKLMLRAFMSNYYSLGKMDQLKAVGLCLLPGVHQNNSNSLLPSFAQTGSLQISCDSIKRMCEYGYLPFRFNKLQKLTLYHNGLTDDIIPSMLKFLQELQPGLKDLFIIPSDGREIEQRMSSLNPSGFGANFWKTQNSLLAGGLEKLAIKLVGGENEESFVEYILNNATKLKKVVINPRNSLPLPIQIANKLINLSQANGATLLHHVGNGGVTFEA